MKIEPFLMERWQSLHEHSVEINLSDSGVHPMSLRELLDEEELERLADLQLGYTQTNGSPELRAAVANLYDGATIDHIEITCGGAEANFVATWSLVEPGDEVVFMTPNYMQIDGIARSLGANVISWPWIPDHDAGRWRVDLDALADAVDEKTRLIAICNPNNPTGATLAAAELDAIAAIADRHGCWILSDEIYRGSELDGEPTSSMWGRGERVVVTNSLSKSYGLPGLRLGWIAAPPTACADFWLHHDYTSIAPAALSDAVATLALTGERRDKLLRRARDWLLRNIAGIEGWLRQARDLVRCIPPRAGAMLYLDYGGVGSTDIAEELRRDRGVLIVPGDHFGMDGWLRVGFGGELETVLDGLTRLVEILDRRKQGP